MILRSLPATLLTCPRKHSRTRSHVSTSWLHRSLITHFCDHLLQTPLLQRVQRLKGLTTGTLPTFIDAGSNFAGDAIEEDSLIYELKAAAQRLIHLGDDTWEALFPGYFDPELSMAYESLVVEDLHTVDNGVIEHIFSLLAKPEKWDVMFAHFLGVDHAGHEHGPYHPAMREKLQQMDHVIRDVIRALDDDTLLVVMGDHGMDSSGNHGGESDDEIQAALWMYSRKGIFGRTQVEHLEPSRDAMDRPVNQIDLVPTLALLLGIPIPFNSLGSPIEEAFVGRSGTSLQNLTQVSRLAALGVERYQVVYSNSTGKDSNTSTVVAQRMWDVAAEEQKPEAWAAAHASFYAYQVETLSIYKGLWATFDLFRMAMGTSICALGVILLCFFMKTLLGDDAESQPVPSDFAATLKNVLVGSLLWLVCSFSARIASIGSQDLVDSLVFTFAIGGIIGAFTHFLSIHGRFRRLKAPSLWSWLGIIFVVSQSVGFASNSYNIWEDNVLLFFLSTFAIVVAAHSPRQDNKFVRIQSVCYSILFAVLGRITFYSQRCREEQMPTCYTTYFGATGSAAAIQNLIPLIIAVALPLVIRPYLPHPVHHSGVAKNWISWGLQFGLVLNASYWFLNSIDNADWFEAISKDSLKAFKVRIAQFQLVLGFPTGIAAFIWRDETASSAKKSRSRIQSRHEMNTVRARYLYLLATFLLPALLVQEPLGAGSLFLFFCQIISLAEILHTNSLQIHPVGPIMLGILGPFHFFTTGHQATLSSIQWRSAFIAFHNLSYPESPFLVMLNTFGAQILVANAVPLIPLWRSEGKFREAGSVSKIGGSVAAHLLYHGAISLSTMVWAGSLRRHLMLYRVFCPRFMMSAVVLLVVDVVSIGNSLNGARWSISSGRTRGAV